MTNPNQAQDEKKMLDKFAQESEQDLKIKSLLKTLIRVYANISSREARNKIGDAIVLLESKGLLKLSRQDKQDLVKAIDSSAHKIKQEGVLLEKIKKNILEKSRAIESGLGKLANEESLYDEHESFFWTSKNGKDNVSKLKSNNKKLLEIIILIRTLKQNILTLGKYLPNDQEYFTLLKEVNTLLSLVHFHLEKAKELQAEREKEEKDKNLLSDPKLASALSSQIKEMYAISLRLNQHIPALIENIDSCLHSLAEAKTLIEKEKLMIISSPLTKEPLEIPQEHLDNKKPRILMLTHEYLTEGGVATVTRKLTKYLRKDFNVDVLERSIKEGEIGLFRYYINASEHPAFEFKDMSNFFNKYPQLKLSLVHTQSINFAPGPNNWNNGGIDELKTIYRNIPVICTCHSVVKYEETIKKADWLPYSITCQEQTLKSADKIIVLHNFGKNLIQKYYPEIKEENISVIPNGVELHSHFFDALERVEKSTERVFSSSNISILYVGRISHEKGLSELVQALPHLKHKYPLLKLLIVGDCQSAEEYYGHLKNQLREYNCEANVEWLGFVKEEDQAEAIYTKYKPDMAILPSHHESFPMFALEAISHGVPLLVTDCDGPREIYSPFRVSDSKDGVRKKQAIGEIENPLPGIERPLAIAVDPKDYHSIVEAVFWVLEHSRETHLILKNAMREVKDKYNWEAIAKVTGNLYKACMTGGHFISPYGETKLSEEMYEHGKREANLKKDNAKVGVIGHFNNKDGSTPDGVARANENVFAHLRKEGYYVEGYAFVGSERDDGNGKVNFYDSSFIAEKIRDSDIDIAIIHAAAEHADRIIDACKSKGIRSIFMMPYWGVWKGTFHFAEKADILVTFTKDYATKLRAKTGTDCRYIPLPVDVSFWKREASDFIQTLKPASWPKDTFNIAYVGRVGVVKMIHTLIKPFKEFIIDKGHLNFRLIICGLPEKNMGDLLKREMEDNKMGDYVAYVERQFNSKEVRDIYSSCDAFIFPSSFETYGQSNLEAISCEAPTVAPGVTSFGDYAVPSMANLPDYPFAFKAGYLYDEKGELRVDGVPHDWGDCFNKVIWISEHKGEAAAVMKKWSDFIHHTMSLEIVGKLIEKALWDAYNMKP